MSQHDFYYEFSGTSREIGLAHGKALKPVIHKAVTQWQEFLSTWSGKTFEELLAGFTKQTNYMPAIEKYAPHTLDEIRGIAEGAEMDYDLVYAWQMVDEVIDYIVEYIYIEKCSTVGAYDQAEGLAPILGKTQDLPHCYIGAGVLIRTKNTETGADLFNSTIAGIVNQDGMNQNLGFCLNHIGKLARDESGLPVVFVARLLLEQCNSVEEAVDLLKELPHASGMNYGLVDKTCTRTFEVSANSVNEYTPLPELKRIWHTNHPLSNEDYCRDIATWNRLSDEEAGNTQKRFDYLEREISKPEQILDVARAKALLSSREAPVSSHTEDSFPTINGLLFEFGSTPTLFFAPGPPSKHDFVAFSFD